MLSSSLPWPHDFDTRFKVYHELMARRVREILLVLSPFDAFIMEEDGSLASRIVNEYRGLNLSRPPRLTRVSTGREALDSVRARQFDLVLTTAQIDDMDCFRLGLEIKKLKPGLPVILLAHEYAGLPAQPVDAAPGLDAFYVWSANPDFLMSLVKNVEDRLNVDLDTKTAMVRVLLLVEDSPGYRSLLLPLLYREVVRQTQAVLDETLNEEHRLLKMRARPKILMASNYEEAQRLIRRYRPFLFGLIADARFSKKGRPIACAGLDLLGAVRRTIPDLPLLLLSSDAANREMAERIPAVFLDKNASDLPAGLHDFFLNHLGFGDFIFRRPDGTAIDRADTLATFEKKLAAIPEECFRYHVERNHFSNWIMARSEVDLASSLHISRRSADRDPQGLRPWIIAQIHRLRHWRQLGVVARFRPEDYEPTVNDFVKIGNGAMGGKALGLAFMAAVLSRAPGLELAEKFPDLQVRIPETLIITTDGYEAFIRENRLADPGPEKTDQEIATLFRQAVIPAWLREQLAAFLSKTDGPLCVRSSSIQEDARYQPFAGLYVTRMLANCHPEPAVRVDELLAAIKLVYASTFFAGPRAFARAGQMRGGPPAMAVIIQQLAGRQYGDFFYPAIAGTAQSTNFYPIAGMQADEGIASIALGFGKTVVEGEKCLRFSPVHPDRLPQFSTVEEILDNCQRQFYALRLSSYPVDPAFLPEDCLEKRELAAAGAELPVAMLTSAYLPEEQRLRDSATNGIRVLTFARLLKHRLLPLPEMLTELLRLGRQGLGAPVQIEFAVNLATDTESAEFHFLQIRPLPDHGDREDVRLTTAEAGRAFCISTQPLGHGRLQTMADIVQVRLETLTPATAKKTANEISRLNARLLKEKRPYLLIGPGRWGSADPWLGIPVQWQDISGVGAMIEYRPQQSSIDTSQGSHFFQNITARRIPYLTVVEAAKAGDFLDWPWLASQPVLSETPLVRHVRLTSSFILKIDASQTRAILYEEKESR
ncbi:MAG: phosphoenolpyruvate synthase/pyruvate phosphate dikinase [Deltaproteobacteria bacterium RIFOXYD12_FULL_57_12]|nr:MAG: phosphoenolpyruvate synthase/pyruvate phosphate dikinase [Deltaproteobacteria bacterium RIFOXYD12_FULL_57_12]